MDRKQFLKNLQASRVKLRPVQIYGWDGLVYLKPQSVGDIRETLIKQGEEDEQPRDKIKKDPLYFARAIGKLVYDEKGERLFDYEDDAQMTELMEVLAESAPTISKQINDAYNAINTPSAEEVTPEGKLPSASTS